jgi:uncharacterized protein (TIGR02594 family)
MAQFVRAFSPAPKVVIYQDDAGREYVREGGSRSWRNFNAGNIQKGTFADAHGAIGGDSRFAIFPSEQIGFDAVVALLGTPAYVDLTIAKAIEKYAPPQENDTKAYIRDLTSRTGLSASTKLRNLSEKDLGSIADAIKVIEGWLVGVERENISIGVASGATKMPIRSAGSASADWMKVAFDEAALPPSQRSEWPDPGENPRILKYFDETSPWFEALKKGGDEVDWCAAFVNWCLQRSGYSGTGHPGSRSFFWNKNHNFVKIKEPIYGSIAVFRDQPFGDPTWQSGTGHVGFVVDWSDSHLTLLGGNQNKTVKQSTYPKTIKSGSAVKRRLETLLLPAMN